MEQWKRGHTLLLIAEYKKKEILYKVNHPDHLKIHKKNAALEEILFSLKGIKPNLTIGEIKRKIKILHQQMRQEKKKMRASMRSVMTADSAYIPTLWCFKELSFLLDANDEVRDHSSIECDNIMSDTCSETDISEIGRAKKRKHTNEEISALRQAANKSMALVHNLLETNSEGGREEIFCKMLCSELKQLKLEETYDNVTADLFAIIRKAKAEEREKLLMESRGTPTTTQLTSSSFAYNFDGNNYDKNSFNKIEPTSPPEFVLVNEAE